MTGAVAAIVLSGGRASRLDGQDKARLRVGGRAMIDSVTAAAAAVADTVVTVGPGGTVREDPPWAGPVAGLIAGLRALPESAEVVVVLPCDLPDLDADTLRTLLASLASAGSATSAALAVDPRGRDQYLLAAWDRRALTRRIAAIARRGGAPPPVRVLYDDEVLVRVRVGDPARDVDTWADLAGRGPVALAHVGPVLRAGLPRAGTGERAPLAAVGAVLAAPLVAADPMPRDRVSAMDGYALAGPGPWRLAGPPRPAGDGSIAALAPGTACVVATGALVPDGTSRVLRHELVAVTGTEVTALPGADGVDDLRPTGEDWAAGHELAPEGATLDAALASAALSAGVEAVTVRGPVRAAVVTTGDEVVPAATPSPLAPGRIRDTVGPLLGAVLARAGFAPPAGAVAHCADTTEAMGALLAGATADVVVLVGATGHGVADHLRSALEGAGARIVLDGVRVRPGGSQLVALLPDGRVLLGLPGNPLAAVAAAATTGRAVVDALTGRRRTPVLATVPDPAQLAAPNRSRILPARPDGAGGWAITGRVRTAHLADLTGAPALAVVPEAAGPGAPAEVLDWI